MGKWALATAVHGTYVKLARLIADNLSLGRRGRPAGQ
jgi:hypothetical protein